MKTYYRDFYGITASITERKDGTALLKIRDSSGKLVKKSIYRSERGAKCALSRFSDGTIKSV